MKETDKRLIEHFLPVTELNEIAAAEKKHPKHPVALVHYWPARRPITASRAAIYSALVPAPKDEKGRAASAKFVEKLSAFKVDRETLATARDQIKAANGGKAPRVLDMFAGGGAIPLEALRLGCDSHALDYNPVAHLIELCTLVYPQRFGASLADDLEKWGLMVLKRVRGEVGDLYPNIRVTTSAQVSQQLRLFGGETDQEQEPVTYIWVRTVPCRKPGCKGTVPLVSQAWLRKKGGFVAAVPRIKKGSSDLVWEIRSGESTGDVGAESEEQTGAGEAACLICTTPATDVYVKQAAVAGNLGEVLASVVVDSSRSKVYLPASQATTPDAKDLGRRIASFVGQDAIPLLDRPLIGKLRDQLPAYGFERFRDLFTQRQLLVLLTLVKHIRQAHKEMTTGGMPADRAKAVATYLAMAFGRLANSFTKFCRWQGQDQKTIAAMGDRQALKMVYDYSEINPFADTAGCLPFALDNEVHCIRQLAGTGREATVTRGNAEELPYEEEFFDAVVTDPPYYSSIYYADLSAFFYVWHQRSVGDLYPEQFAFPNPPKRREAVAQPSEHDGDGAAADEHYQAVMEKAFREARRVLKPGAPLICVYAHRTTEGWATLIRALVQAKMTVTEAWPVQTEAKGRTNALKAAALSDSIFFVARRRESTATGEYETVVRPELERIARERVATLWANGNGIAGADLLMAAVGACLRPYTQFARVEYANGDEFPAEKYLHEVEGVVLDTMLEEIFGLSSASVSSVDPVTRFYVLWRFTYRESALDAGEAIVFSYPQGIELDGPTGLSGAAPRLAEKKSAKYRIRDFTERGDDEDLGLPDGGKPAPLIDILHRTLWLMDREPRKLGEYLRAANVNREQLRLVAQALSGPTLKGSGLEDVSPTVELAALIKLTANWRSVVEDNMSSTEERAEQKRGQKKFFE
jgi:putative DNA methylase